MNATERFERWFAQSISKLKELPTGDGAFAALMIAIPLYERYIIGKLKLSGSETKEADVKAAVSADLKLDSKQRSIFWDMFRNGFMHQAMPTDGKTKWMVSSEFGEIPEFKEVEGVNCILLDPWKFADRVIKKYKDNPDVITASDSFPLASIFLLSPDEDTGTESAESERESAD